MNRLFFIIAIAITFCYALPCEEAKAESQTEKYLGEHEMCLDVVRIKESLILDDQCILFETYGGAFYVNRLPIRCYGLKISNGFGYETSIEKLCKQDIIELLENSSAPTGTCMLGDFVRFKYKGTISDVRKLLKDGLLKALIQEGAFEEIFPVEKTNPK